MNKNWVKSGFIRRPFCLHKHTSPQQVFNVSPSDTLLRHVECCSKGTPPNPQKVAFPGMKGYIRREMQLDTQWTSFNPTSSSREAPKAVHGLFSFSPTLTNVNIAFAGHFLALKGNSNCFHMCTLTSFFRYVFCTPASNLYTPFKSLWIPAKCLSRKGSQF